MNVNKKILLSICLLFLSILNVNAATCRDNLTYSYCVTRTSDWAESSAGSYSVPYKYIDGSEVICTQYARIAPLGCNNYTTFSAPVEAGVSVIVNSNLSYICKERALTKFLHNKYNSSGRNNYNLNQSPWNDSSKCGANADKVYDNAVAKYDLVNAIVNDEITFNSSLKFSKSGDNFVASTTVNIPSGMGDNWSCSASGSGSKVSYSGTNYTTVTVTTPISNAGSTITLTCAGYKQSYNKIWYYYNCQGYNNNSKIVDGQSLVQKSSTKNEAYNDNSTSGTIPTTGTVNFKKVVEGTTVPIFKEVGIRIYNNKTHCDNDSTANKVGNDIYFTATTSKTLQQGTYYIREFKTPGNEGDYSVVNQCQPFTVNIAETTNVNIANRSECITDVLTKMSENTIDNIDVRFELYRKYKADNKDFRNFLNFNDKYNIPINENEKEKKAAYLCSHVTPNYGGKEECLDVDKVDNTSFDKDNLSIYNDEITGNNNSKAYCLTDFELDSNVEIKDNISAGQMVYSADKNESAITATLTKTCYVPETEFNNYSFETTTTNYYTKDEIVNNFNVLKSYRKNKNFYYKNNLSSYHARKGILVKRNNEIYELVGTNSILNTANCNYSRRFQDLEGNYICLKHPYNIIPCYNCKYNYFDILYNYKEKKFYLVQQSQLHTQFTQIEDIYVKNTDRVLNTSVNDFYSNYLNYEDYITNIYLNNNIINLKEILESPVVMEDSGYFKKITGVLTANYTLNPVYAYKMSGNTPEDNSECYNEETGILDYKCSLIGYGVMSKFKDGDKTDVTSKSAFNFKIDNSSAKKPIEKKFEFIDNKCEYTVNPEIIKYENTENGNLELEFRSIDKNEPFSNRETNSNWCDEENCASNNNTVQSVIKGRNDSYNSTQAGALYTTETDSAKIILTPDIIKKIRDYSSGTGDYAGNPHPYDNYELVCDINGTNCRNAFLEEFEIIRIP